MELSIPKTHSVNVCNKVGLMQINKGLSTQHLTVSSLPLQQWTGLVFFLDLWCHIVFCHKAMTKCRSWTSPIVVNCPLIFRVRSRAG